MFYSRGEPINKITHNPKKRKHHFSLRKRYLKITPFFAGKKKKPPLRSGLPGWASIHKQKIEANLNLNAEVCRRCCIVWQIEVCPMWGERLRFSSEETRLKLPIFQWVSLGFFDQFFCCLKITDDKDKFYATFFLQVYPDF